MRTKTKGFFLNEHQAPYYPNESFAKVLVSFSQIGDLEFQRKNIFYFQNAFNAVLSFGID